MTISAGSDRMWETSKIVPAGQETAAYRDTPCF